MKEIRFLAISLLVALSMGFSSCATNIPISLLCNEQHIEIYTAGHLVPADFQLFII